MRPLATPACTISRFKQSISKASKAWPNCEPGAWPGSQKKGDITDIDAGRRPGSTSAAPRTARSIEAGTVYHVLNRGNGRIGTDQLRPASFDHFEADIYATVRVGADGWHREGVLGTGVFSRSCRSQFELFPAWVSENALGTGRASRCRDTFRTTAHDIVSACAAHSTRCYRAQW